MLAHHDAAAENEAYQEKARPDLYNIAKKIRDMRPAYTRFLYVAEVTDKASKSNLEKDLTTYFMEYQHKYEMTGLLLILNNVYIHLIECETTNFKDLIIEFNKTITEKGSIYKGVYITYFCEEKGSRLYDFWL